ncbi:MAG TPA: outer membrane beta-barrel protein [Bacteroidales bacterium]|nr:outer membrane beta-barrel protein [Bacteroidales bacterium]
MKTLTTTLMITFLALSGISLKSQPTLKNYWQVGIGLGEIPMDGSFKPSITFGYHFSEKIYTGVIYQFKDQISRGASSFNAKSTGLDGLLSSSETVSQRFMLQLRYTPVKFGPYLSTGFVFNGKDSETMHFDAREREIAGETYTGDIVIQQTRPAGWGLALGIGYQYNFKNGLSANAEWTPAWFQYPDPSYAFGGSAELTDKSENELVSKMDKGFKSSITNYYKVFHIGVAYRIK